jgi:hypothetical protein
MELNKVIKELDKVMIINESLKKELKSKDDLQLDH